MGMALTSGATVLTTAAHGSSIILVVMEFTSGLMADSMKAAGKTTRCMEKASTPGLTTGDMTDST